MEKKFLNSLSHCLNWVVVNIYEVCPKSNETGVIKTLLKTIEIYQSQIP